MHYVTAIPSCTLPSHFKISANEFILIFLFTYQRLHVLCYLNAMLHTMHVTRKFTFCSTFPSYIVHWMLISIYSAMPTLDVLFQFVSPVSLYKSTGNGIEYPWHFLFTVYVKRASAQHSHTHTHGIGCDSKGTHLPFFASAFMLLSTQTSSNRQ